MSLLSKVKSTIWPIERKEVPKLVTLLIMKFFFSFIYAILNCMKDTLIVTAKSSGAEVIPVLKGWVVLPAAFIATIIFAKLSNILTRTKLFYLTIFSFMAVLVVYGFYLYPNASALEPTTSVQWLESVFGSNFNHWIAVYRYWFHSLFFVTCELWAGFGIFLLFWGLVNQVTNFDEAKRTYTLFVAAGDLASIFSGPLVLYYVRKYSGNSFAWTMQTMITYVVVFSLIISALHFFLTRYLSKKSSQCASDKSYSPFKQKTKLSLRQSIKHILSSKHLLCITVLVIGVGFTINLVEVTWKAKLRELYPLAADYQAFMSQVTFYIGVIAFLTVFLIGGGLIRKVGWHISTQITPFGMGITGVFFLLLVILQKHIPNMYILGLSSLNLLVIFGAFQNILSKVLKYSFFDPTKEMAFIPLDQESKVKGKAAIDVVASRLGKSSSSWVQVGLIDLIGTGSIINVTHLLIPIVSVVTILWVLSVTELNKELQKKDELLV